MPLQIVQNRLRWMTLAAAAVMAAGIVLLVARAMRPAVTVTDVVEGPVVEAFYATGTVEPVREYPVKSNTDGILERVLVDKGDHAAKGQVLAVVHNSELQFLLNKAKAELKEKEARAAEATSPVLMEFDAKLRATGDMLEIGRRDEQRLTALAEQNAASVNDRDTAATRVHELWSQQESHKAQRAAAKLLLEAELESARSAASIAQWNFDQQTLRSPVDGVVLDRPVAQGTRLAVNDAVLRVADVRPERLVMRAANVDEEDVARLDPGQAVRISLYSFRERIFDGTVRRIYDKADAERRTFEVDVAFAAPDKKLAAGMTGELAFITGAKDRSTVVPAQALQGDAVYLVRGGRLARSVVRVGLKSVERVEVLSGAQPGDTVVISPTAGLSDGRRVRIAERLAPPAAAALNTPPPTEVFRGFN